jgi:hypothetical protein
VKCTQTELTQEKVEELVARSNTEMEVQGAKIEELTRRLSTSQKTAETQKDTISRCLSVIKEINLIIIIIIITLKIMFPFLKLLLPLWCSEISRGRVVTTSDGYPDQPIFT